MFQQFKNPINHYLVWSILMFEAAHKNGINLHRGEVQRSCAWIQKRLIDQFHYEISRECIRKVQKNLISIGEIEINTSEKPPIILLKRYNNYQNFSWYKIDGEQFSERERLLKTPTMPANSISGHNVGKTLATHSQKNGQQRWQVNNLKQASSTESVGNNVGNKKSSSAPHVSANVGNTVSKPLKIKTEKSPSRTRTIKNKNNNKGGDQIANVNCVENSTSSLNSDNKPVENSRKMETTCGKPVEKPVENYLKSRKYNRMRDDPKIGRYRE